ncbi:hypothetical protein [Nonomuraea sp. NPDC046570]|uniref:hypothetical protein n=1 Tax=Nonomuraea sp. NPDC046570 TaxID=3155255 RepID=UPI0034047F42
MSIEPQLCRLGCPHGDPYLVLGEHVHQVHQVDQVTGVGRDGVIGAAERGQQRGKVVGQFRIEPAVFGMGPVLPSVEDRVFAHQPHGISLGSRLKERLIAPISAGHSSYCTELFEN